MQRPSTKLRDVEHQDGEQLSLIPNRKIISRPVNLAHIPVLQSTKQALEYACQLADVAPKEIYLQMEIDKGTWSRICSGEWDLDGRDIPRLNQVVGNSAYLLYLNHIDGWDLVYMRKTLSDQERQLEEERLENAKLRTRNAFLEDLVVKGFGGRK